MDDPVKIGISSCLLGQPVRYDGGHKLDSFIRDTLGRYVTFVPVCPEVECGLPVPREAMHLVGDPRDPRLMTIRSGIDHTERMKSWARRRLEELERENLCGFIFKSKSPSSGMLRVRIYNEAGVPVKSGSGVFARAFMERFPRIPVEDEGRLQDPGLRENFIERLFALKRWRDVLARERRLGTLVAFHTSEKLLILSHSPVHYRRLGRLVAAGRDMPIAQLYDDYEHLFMQALALKSTIAKNINVLQHIMGYFKKHLSADEKHELLEVINDYRQAELPLIVPVTLLNHYVRKYREPYLSQQSYLRPHPTALKLRNHV